MAKSNNIFLGTEMKLAVSIEPIGSYTMVDYDFTVELYCSPAKKVVVEKSEMINETENSYIVCVDTEMLGPGKLKCKVIAQIPDGNFKDDYRTEVQVVDTGIEIVKA